MNPLQVSTPPSKYPHRRCGQSDESPPPELSMYLSIYGYWVVENRDPVFKKVSLAGQKEFQTI